MPALTTRFSNAALPLNQPTRNNHIYLSFNVKLQLKKNSGQIKYLVGSYMVGVGFVMDIFYPEFRDGFVIQHALRERYFDAMLLEFFPNF